MFNLLHFGTDCGDDVLLIVVQRGAHNCIVFPADSRLCGGIDCIVP